MRYDTAPRGGVDSQAIIRTAAIDIGADATVGELEQLYGAEVVVFRPEAGFAILGFTAEALSGTFTVQADDMEDNQDTFSSPVTALGTGTWSEGFSAWSGGFSAWSGGFSAWSGGFSAWSGGFSAWSGGAPSWQGDPQTYTPMDNLGLWNQIGLPWAHQVADKLGEGVVVAVIDTGIDLAHPAFAGRLLPGWDFIDNDDHPQEEPGDAYGHGTGVAGVILQVAPNVSILPIRVLDGNGYGDTDDVAQAVDWAVAQGADVINLSLGGTEVSKVLEAMLKYAAKRNVLIVTSSGNSGDENVTYPASASVGGGWKSRLIGVASVDVNDVKSPFSTYGKKGVDLAAPGEFIFTAVPDERVGYWSGTSFAAPLVTGAIALALAEPNLDVKPKDLGKEVAKELMDDLYDIPGNRRFKDALGEGRLDLESFLEEVLDIDD